MSGLRLDPEWVYFWNLKSFRQFCLGTDFGKTILSAKFGVGFFFICLATSFSAFSHCVRLRVSYSGFDMSCGPNGILVFFILIELPDPK